jgi:HD superfamily phosphohydrolase
MPDKVFCDPVYRHIIFDKDKDAVLLQLLGCPEVQRLRRVRQLGVSFLTYHGAEHSRFSHALGTCHLMTTALDVLGRNCTLGLPEDVRLASRCAALLHDLGHGPFSHLTEKVCDIKHEQVTNSIILEDTSVTKVLSAHSAGFPALVSGIFLGEKPEFQYVSDILSSQLDVDRMDYLLRDAYFCGVPYGSYDYLRILHTMSLGPFAEDGLVHPVWLTKGKHAVEQFLYARFYMYWAVYYHKTTCGFEALFAAIMKRARRVKEDALAKIKFLPGVVELVKGKPTTAQFLQTDDHIMMAQISLWLSAKDAILADLCRRFMTRDGFKPIGPVIMQMSSPDAVLKVRQFLESKGLPHEYYFPGNTSVAVAYDYYRPDKEEKSPKTEIRLTNGSVQQEISRELKGVRALIDEAREESYYYIPREFWPEMEPMLRPLLG